MWLANDNATEQKELEKMGVLEFYFRLNKKAADAKAAQKQKLKMNNSWQNK